MAREARVCDWMNDLVLVLHEGTDGLLARDAVEAHPTGHACVLRDGKLVGVLSDRDFPPLEEEDDWTVGEVMTDDPATVGPDVPLSDAVELMLREHIHCLPVLDEDEVIGILTDRDLLQALLATLRTPEAPAWRSHAQTQS